MRLTPLLAVAFVISQRVPLAAQAPLPLPLRPADAVYMAQGLVLVASPPRQLTLNAHVQDFLYRPDSDSIAYSSVQDDGDRETCSVMLTDPRRTGSSPRTLLTVSGDSPNSQAQYRSLSSLTLSGWSADGQHLLIRQDSGQEVTFLLGSVSDTSAQTDTLPQPPAPPVGTSTIQDAMWSPRHRHILLTQESFGKSMPPSSVMTALLYDPADGGTHPLTVAEGLSVRGWLDEEHLFLVRQSRVPGERSAFFSHDITTDTDTPIARPKLWPVSERPAPGPPGLVLEVQPQTLTDALSIAQTHAQSLWVRRVEAPQAMSALTIGVTPGQDDPQAQWSPDGNSVAFIAHGDLFVSTLSEREASSRERLTAGETLDCTEERQLAVENVNRIGSGLLRYARDHQGRFPPQNDVRTALAPYLRDTNVFALGSHAFVYREPHRVTATPPLGFIDLPCARIVLSGEGHVKILNNGNAKKAARKGGL